MLLPGRIKPLHVVGEGLHLVPVDSVSVVHEVGELDRVEFRAVEEYVQRLIAVGLEAPILVGELLQRQRDRERLVKVATSRGRSDWCREVAGNVDTARAS